MIYGWRRAVRVGVALTGVLGPIVGVTATSAAAAPKASFTTVASGFDNPRGLAFGEEGRLFVAEAGKFADQRRNATEAIVTSLSR